MKAIYRRLLPAAGVLFVLLAAGAGLLWWYVSMWGQEPDPAFDATVASPAFGAEGPSVLFDQAHFNAHSLQDTYAPFAALLRNDGYRLVESDELLRPQVLEDHDILVVVNARGSNESARRGKPAFRPAEIEAVYAWVSSGGSLLLVADHAPFGSAARAMAERFGVEMSNFDTVDPVHHDPVSGSEGFLLFSRENGLLGSHPIVQGRSQGEQISRVLTFNGQSLRGPEGSAMVLALSDGAKDRLADGSERSARGRAQALALEPGEGRIVVLGEAAVLTAQIGHVPFQEPIYAGMNRTDVDNKQFTLNVMHWLSWLVR